MVVIVYTKLHRLIEAEGVSLRKLSEKTGVDYGTLWRLIQAESNLDVFKDGKARKGKVIMNLTCETLDKLCCYFKVQPKDCLMFRG